VATGRNQDDRNAVPTAVLLIKPMGNMPFYEEIIMFEKIQRKTITNHKVAYMCFTLTGVKKKKAQQITN
jgi:hypothetical protein